MRPRRLLADYESIVAALSVINPPNPCCVPPIPWHSCSRIDDQRRNLSSHPLSISMLTLLGFRLFDARWMSFDRGRFFGGRVVVSAFEIFLNEFDRVSKYLQR